MLNPIEGFESLIEKVFNLKKEKKVNSLVNLRIKEFQNIKKENSRQWFNELVYCILTAYSSAEKSQDCVDALCDIDAIYNGTIEEIKETLKSQGHRFAVKRAEYIFEARNLAPILKKTIIGFKNDSEKAREWLVKNIKGIGWKEASHFLRNVGYLDVAILDRHILKTLEEHDLIPLYRSKGMTKKRYLEYEKILEKVAKRAGLKLGELDLYLWYNKTGKVLK